MSLSAVLANAVSGLAVAQNALSVTSGNVANVNTEGYTRKLAQQEAVLIDGRGAGARATDTARAVDEFLGLRPREQQGRLGRTETLKGIHDQIQERLFGAPGELDRGLTNRISRVAGAAEALAGGPDQPALATAFIGAVQDLARELGSAAGEVQSLRRDLDQRIAALSDTVNADLQALADINGQIARSGISAALLDRQDALLDGLAGAIEVSVYRQDNGTVGVYTRSGQVLLDRAPRRLVYEPAAQVGPGTGFGAIRVFREGELDPATGDPLVGAGGAVLVTSGVRAELTPELLADATADTAQRIVSPFQSGRLQGMLEARDLVLPGLADQLGELAGLACHALNAAHNAAVPQPPPGSLTGTRTATADFAGAARGGTAYLAVIDLATGDAVTTLAIDVAGAADAAGLAAQITADLGGYGAAALNGQGALQITLAAGYGIAVSEGDSAVTVVDAAGHARDHGFAHYFGLNDLLLASGSDPTQLAVRPDILADGQRLSRSRLDVAAGAPPSGRLGGAGDNRGAQALAAAFETSAAAVARGGLPAGDFRLADYASEIVALGAVAAERMSGLEANDRALADDLAIRRAEVSGVNLDEELSRLVLYQQAYSVSARLISITNELFDDLLAIAG